MRKAEPNPEIFKKFYNLYSKCVVDVESERDVIGSMLTLLQRHITPDQYTAHYALVEQFKKENAQNV